MASKGSGSRESGGPGNSLVGDFKLGHEIGRGSFAVVFKGHHQVSPPEALLLLFFPSVASWGLAMVGAELRGEALPW